MVLTTIFMLSCVKSSTPRARRSLSGPAVVGAVQIGIPASHKVLDDWCKNVTKHLNTTQEKFVSYEDCVRFNANLKNFITCNCRNLWQLIRKDVKVINSQASDYILILNIWLNLFCFVFKFYCRGRNIFLWLFLFFLLFKHTDWHKFIFNSRWPFLHKLISFFSVSFSSGQYQFQQLNGTLHHLFYGSYGSYRIIFLASLLFQRSLMDSLFS